MLGAPKLDAGLQVWSHDSGVKGQNPLPCPPVHSSLDVAQDTVGFLGCQHTLMAHVELLILQYLPSPSPQGCSRATLHPAWYLCLGLLRPACRTLHLALLNFMRFMQAHLQPAFNVFIVRYVDCQFENPKKVIIYLVQQNMHFKFKL